MNVPQLETERLILKQITLADAPAYQKYFDDYEIIRHLSPNFPWPFPKDGAIEFITKVILASQEQDEWFWGIFLKSYPLEMIVQFHRFGPP